jgi:TonB family protein
MLRRLIFSALMVSALAVPGALSAQVSGTAEKPEFTPLTVKPELTNRDEVARVLELAYPSALRAANISGTVITWIKIGTDGAITDTRVATSSGNADFDKAALAVAQQMKFSPGKNLDGVVAAWVQIPVSFRSGR